MKPRVILSAGNIAHYHHTALALQSAGYLWKYFCVFSGEDDLGFVQKLLPSGVRKRLMGKALPGLDPGRIRKFTGPYLFAQLLNHAGVIDQERTNAWFSELYDRATLNKAVGADILHFVNSMGLKTAQRAKAEGCIIVCDVRAEHVEFQEALLRSEYDRLELPYRSARALYRDRLVAEYKLADFLLVPSSYVAETMIRSGIAPDKVFVVPYGVDPSRFLSRGAGRGHGVEERPFRILFIGQVIPRKGLHYLIQAFRKLQLPNIELVMIGNGEPAYQKLLMEMALPEHRIRFIGRIPQMELSDYYQSSDIFVLPTLSEGSALVIYEAMSAGLPVITTPNAGSVIRDGQDGFVIPICDVSALKEKILFLHQHPEVRIPMGKASQERVQEFTWERYGERLLEMYDRILIEKGT